MNTIINNGPEKYVNKIIKYSNKLSKIVQKKAHIKSDYIVYEFLFFFYALNDVSMNLCDVPIAIVHRVIPLLFDPLLETHKDIKILAFCRAKRYYNILLNYSEKISVEFLQDSFQFISELSAYSVYNKNFADKNTNPSTLPEWISKAIDDDLLQKINSILVKKSNLIFDFLVE